MLRAVVISIENTKEAEVILQSNGLFRELPSVELRLDPNVPTSCESNISVIFSAKNGRQVFAVVFVTPPACDGLWSAKTGVNLVMSITVAIIRKRVSLERMLISMNPYIECWNRYLIENDDVSRVSQQYYDCNFRSGNLMDVISTIRSNLLKLQYGACGCLKN